MVFHTTFETRLHFENYVYSVKRGSREINETCCGVFSSIHPDSEEGCRQGKAFRSRTSRGTEKIWPDVSRAF